MDLLFCRQMDQTLIDRPEIKEENSLQITGSKKMVYLSKIVSSGGEGTVFDTDIPGMVAKIYKKSENTKGRERKIQRMTERKPDIPGICWPIDRLQTVDGKFSGYLMRKADGLELATSVFRPLKTELRGFPEWSRKDLVELGITLCSFFVALHRNNVLV